jgi:putative transposase
MKLSTTKILCAGPTPRHQAVTTPGGSWRHCHGSEVRGAAGGLEFRHGPVSYRRHRFSPSIIQHAIWLYLRFTLSYRDVEELLAERALDVSYETVRRWVVKFGPVIARNLRRRRPRSSERWHLDEMVVRIAGRRMYLWRAVDHEGEVLDMLVQRRRDRRAALRLMRKLLRKLGFAPKLLTTDKLGSYGAAFRHLGLTGPHEQGVRAGRSPDSNLQNPVIDRAIPCSNGAEESHFVIKKRVALGAQESVSVFTAGAAPAGYGGPLMRVYIINTDAVVVSREAQIEPADNEIVVASLDELRAARLSGKRLLALWNSLPDTEKLTKITDRPAFTDRLWSAMEGLPDPQPMRASKQADVIALLRRPEGATVDEVRAATGWQPHTVRGVFSGALKKKLGLAVIAAKEERGRVYRIAGARA